MSPTKACRLDQQLSSQLYAELEHGDFRPRMPMPAQAIGICRQGQPGTGCFSKLFTPVHRAARLGAACQEDWGFLRDVIYLSFPGGTFCSGKRQRIVDLDKLPRGSGKSVVGLLASPLEKEPWKCMLDVFWRQEKASGGRMNFTNSERRT